MTCYTVTVISAETGKISTRRIGAYADKITAMKIAKHAAHTATDAKDCVPYGPSSLAYVGDRATAIVAWDGA